MIEAAAAAAALSGVDAVRHAARKVAMEQLDEVPLGEAIAQTALDIWGNHIVEPGQPGPWGGAEWIHGFESHPNAMGWTWLKSYDARRAWCGAFAAAVYGRHGLTSEVRRSILPSCTRLHERWKDRRVALTDIQPGDIVVVGDHQPDSKGRATPQGNHITIAIEVVDGLVYTVEGNAKGLLPDGSIAEGVIKRTRPLPISAGGPGRSSAKCPVSGRPQGMEVIHAYRPQMKDFD